MAKDKYDFIQELLENKKLQPTQKERVLLLAKEEIKKDGALGKELEERVKKLEEMMNNSNDDLPSTTLKPIEEALSRVQTIVDELKVKGKTVNATKRRNESQDQSKKH